MLNPAYANETHCRNEKIPDDPKKANSYVTLHISGSEPFELNVS